MVNKQVLITFAIGKYKDEILCDVVPMKATHVLLERPWKYDRKILHDDHTNKISFNFQRHKIILKFLSPKEFNEDQVKRKAKRDNEKGEENKVKSGLIILPHTLKTIKLTRLKIQTAYPKYSSSLSFSSPNHYKYLTYLLNKFRDNFQTPLKGFPLLRGP